MVVLFLVAALGAAPAHAQGVWDSRGWQMLGEQQVSGRVDRDRITVGRYEGRFNKLTLVVLDSELELLDFNIVFADNTSYAPQVQQFFREGARTRVIDLPPAERVISHIDLRYKNLPGGGRAKVQIWGFRIAGAPPPPMPAPPPPPAPAWDSRGWTLLGERSVNGRRRSDWDRIDVGRYEGRFSKLTVVVRDSDVELIDFAVKFARGPEWRPGMSHYFRENQRTRVIDLPGDDRMIRYIDFRYRNLPGGGNAKVQVWGFKSDGAGGGGGGGGSWGGWDNRGWQKLGEQQVSGRVDVDRITVGRYQGKFRQLMLVVLDSDLEMIDVSIQFRRGEPYHPSVTQFFRENTRTRAIDLPGDDRTIEWIEFKYRNLPGGGRAKVQVWGK